MDDGEGAKRRRLDQGGGGGEEERVVHINSLPDAVLGDIVSRLPTRDGARTQLLSRSWRPLWRSAPLNLDPHALYGRIPVGKISRILSAHPGPGRRFSIPGSYLEDIDRPAATLDGWLRSPALDKLQELEIHVDRWGHEPPSPLPAPALRFSSTLRVATFGHCAFPDGDGGTAPKLPLLEKLRLVNVAISESCLHGLVAGCPAMEVLLLRSVRGCSRARILSPSLRIIGVSLSRHWLHHLTIEDAPRLERLLLLDSYAVGTCISVVSAPKLDTLGLEPLLHLEGPRLEFGTTVFQGPRSVSLAMAVHSVKVLALYSASLDMVINFLKCFPSLEKLYIEDLMNRETNAWCRKHRHLIGTLDIHLRKIELRCYQGNNSHVNFAKFFVLNARSLESMILGLQHDAKLTDGAWIERQHGLLQIEKRAAEGARFDFVKRGTISGLLVEMALDF